VAFQIAQRGASQPPLFLAMDGLGWTSAPTGLHFHEDDRAVFNGHQIEFTQAVTFPATDDLKTASLEIPGCRRLATLSE
jgi:hypothetical protein